jgi:3-hydroxymyristoyl/3-hydroxydecanoyl-(acyl carrier protein) dehydratase
MPRILSSEGDASNRKYRLDIDPGLEWFRGHFPGRPVLAGIVQVHWAVLLSASCFGIEQLPLEIKRLKFKNLVIPPDVLDLSLQRLTEREVSFVYAGAAGQCSEGRLVFPGVPV